MSLSLPVAVLLSVLAQAPPGKLFSGPQSGEKTPPFRVLDVSGPNAGKEVDYIAEWKGAPTVICFIHELTRPGAQLLRRLDDYGTRNRDSLRTLFVSLTADVQEAERRLPVSLKALQMKSMTGISLDGKEGPGAYGLNKDVLITVIASKDDKVVDNWAIVSPNETDFPGIQAVLDRLTLPPLDTPEALRAEVLRLRTEVAALRTELDELKTDRSRGMERRPEGRRERMEKAGEKSESAAEKKELPGKRPDDPRLVELLRRLIRPEAKPADIDAAIGDIEAYVKDSADLRKQIADGILLVDHLGYGTDYSKSARKKFTDKIKAPLK